jgi:ABC-type sugar transport system ATPase subunit
MNFIPGEVREGVFEFSATNGNGKAGLGEASYSKFDIGENIPNGPTVLGVRPEDLLARDDKPQLGTVTLDVVEHMGHETIAHFALAGSEHMARLAADAGVEPGDRLNLSIRPDSFHLFAAENGRRLN